MTLILTAKIKHRHQMRSLPIGRKHMLAAAQSSPGSICHTSCWRVRFARAL